MPTAAPIGEAITNSVSTATGVAGSIIEFVTGNPLLMLFLGLAFVGIGISIFKKLKG